MAPLDLSGLPILITGASSGIGLATARACAAAGMPVALAARRTDRLDDAVRELHRAGGKAIAIRCDVADPAECEAAADACVRAFGSLYAVFANAGQGLERATLDCTDAQLRELFEVNFWGTLNTLRPAVERMRAAGRGHALLCASCLSKIGIPYYAAYCATKAAQDHFARALRHELAPAGVRVSSVHPIGTRTEFFDQSAARSGGSRLLTRSDRFMQPPERVADAIVRCLRRPRGEVWTSAPMRLGLGVATMFPGITDAVLGRMVRARLARSAQTPT